MERKSKWEMVEMEDAFKILDEAASGIEKTLTEVSLKDSLGFVLAEDIVASENLPPFWASIMDGYALKFEEYSKNWLFEVFDAKSLAGVAEVELEEFKYSNQSLLYITTGAPVPKYFDTVVPIEETLLLEDGKVEINEIKGLHEGQWIRPVGSDIKTGQTVLFKGRKIGPAEVGILASIGKVSNIQVFQKPTIGIISTGSELVDAGENNLLVGNGKIRDSNTHMISSILISQGFTNIKTYGIIQDTYECIDFFL